ncbi:Gag-Pol polyprotein [Labeo rohita]|uniref:Gag-Pol polyprotein n=1 Tax=Labeo rohita TaxID=84645 RepID=A0ABQ8MF66_LABRO|nr:Gag-Pol polyprotein [Labeo rohita]
MYVVLGEDVRALRELKVFLQTLLLSNVLDDKGPLVRIWSDGLVAEYRKALPFLDLAWSNRTLRSNLDCFASWERDSDGKARVKIAAASFQVNTKNQQKRKCPKREGSCHYCSKPGHWMKECRKSKKTLGEVNSFTQLLISLLTTLKQPLPTSPNCWSTLLSVLDDKGPLVRIWSDGLVAEYRKALPFLDLAWSNRTLRSNLDCFASWERDSDGKARVKIAAASFQSTYHSEAAPPHFAELLEHLAQVLTVRAVCVYAMMSGSILE